MSTWTQFFQTLFRSLTWRVHNGKFDQININLRNATPFSYFKTLSISVNELYWQYTATHAILDSTCISYLNITANSMLHAMLHWNVVRLLLHPFKQSAFANIKNSTCYNLIRLSLTHPDTKISLLFSFFGLHWRQVDSYSKFIGKFSTTISITQFPFGNIKFQSLTMLMFSFKVCVFKVYLICQLHHVWLEYVNCKQQLNARCSRVTKYTYT